MLKRAPILIVEDEPYVALELQATIEAAGGTVVGPVGSAFAALALLETSAVAAAVLDVQLSDRDVTPVAIFLVSRGVPMVFQSAKPLPANLRRSCPDAVLYEKPVSAKSLIETLRNLTQPRPPGS